MFGNNKPSGKPAPRSGGVETLIGRQTEVRGDIHFTGGLHVDGRVQGNVSATSGPEQPAHLSISNTGNVEGSVRVPSLVLNGSIVGDVYTSEKITLGAKARVTGDVHYKFIEMAGGAQVNGKLVHESAEVVAITHEPVQAEAVPLLESGDAAPNLNGQSQDEHSDHAPHYQ